MAATAVQECPIDRCVAYHEVQFPAASSLRAAVANMVGASSSDEARLEQVVYRGVMERGPSYSIWAP